MAEMRAGAYLDDDRGDWNHVPLDQVERCIAQGHGIVPPSGGGSEWARFITRKGYIWITRVCSRCGTHVDGPWPRQRLKDHPDHAQYRLARDNRLGHQRAGNFPPCERCGAEVDTEEHHWAPHHLFEDSDQWPTSHLCPPCHRKWHQVTRTGPFWGS